MPHSTGNRQLVEHMALCVYCHAALARRVVACRVRPDLKANPIWVLSAQQFFSVLVPPRATAFLEAAHSS